MKIAIVNGPNLNLIGIRETNLYGKESFEIYFKEIDKHFPDIELEYFQSNIEGEIVNEIQRLGFSYDGIILNAGGYTHTSVSIADAVASVTTPIVEVHITNVFAREEIRQKSLFAKHCKGVIAGFGLESYFLAIISLMKN